ncbi:MAG: ATP-binding protein [Candidatus Shapirobacteria bacterium]|jgi:hypothetical protein
MKLSDLFNKKKAPVAETPVTEGSKTTKDVGVKPFTEGLVSTKDIIAPSSLEVDFDNVRIDSKYYRTLFVVGYPRFVGINWLSSLVNFDASLTVSMYIYPTDGKQILDDLRRKIAEMEAEINTDIQRGRVVNPTTQAKLEDALNLQTDLVKGEERFFQFGLYVTISAISVPELDRITKNLEAALGALMIISKKATLQMEDGFATTMPVCLDRIKVTRNMDTTSLATTFPFVSSDLSDDKGIMFGINEHNGSLVIFDRFSMPNYNSVVFATAGAGKSYLIKLESIRSLMMGTEIIVIDPENEYRDLCLSVGGQYIAFGYGEESKINPFDLSLVEEEGENALNSKILNLHKLLKIMIGEMDPIEESIIDRAVMDAYKMKGVTPDPESQKREPPLIEDLYKSLIGMEDQKAQTLAARIEKYIKGSFAGIFNQKTNVNLTNSFVVFGIRNLEDALRPVAMHIILDYIWTIVKKTLKKRILVVDEAWYLMQYEDSASFLRGIVKRGRKYYLGVTTITQDVDDFLQTPYGKEIVTNSSIQILLKQHTAAIDQVGEVFYLSEGEKQLLLSADKGEGIFFAGQNHVAIRVIASEEEHDLITSNPEETLKKRAAAAAKKGLDQPIGVGGIKEKINVGGGVATTPQAIAAKPLTKITKPEIKEVVAEIPLKAAETPKAEAAAEPAISKADNETTSEEMLMRKIKEMEEQEKRELEEHAKKMTEEKEKAEKLQNERTLPKYQDLFKTSPLGKLPPLPPLPKFEPPSKPFVPPFKPEVVAAKKEDKAKPIFVDQTKEKAVPQPPQLAKKPRPEFVNFDQQKAEVKEPKTVSGQSSATASSPSSSKQNQKNEEAKMTYDKLFTN